MNDFLFIRDQDELTLTGEQFKSILCEFAKQLASDAGQPIEGVRAELQESTKLKLFISRSIVKMQLDLYSQKKESDYQDSLT